MLKVMTAAVALSGALLLNPSPPVQGAEKGGTFKLIVNASNSNTSLSISDASQLFLKRTTRWGNGGSVQPVDLPTTSPVREGFSREVLGRPAVAIEAYWNKQIFSGQAVPPVVKSTEREVVSYVKENAGAIGYVSADTPLESGVRAVTLSDKK
jgi:ABC-type phosphate transport system substrate-binding protein